MAPTSGASSGGSCRTSSPLLGPEDLVHDLSPGRDHRAQLPPVDDLRRPGAGMPRQPGDLLHRHALVAHHADERGSQLLRHPAGPQSGRRGDPADPPPPPAARSPQPASATATPLKPARSIHQGRDVPPDQILPLSVPQRPRQAVVRLLQRPGRMRGRHLRQRRPHILHGQLLQRDRADNGQQRPQRVPVDLDRLGRAARQALSQPVNSRTDKNRIGCLTCKNSVELRGFEPLTPSMRTRCATGLRYSPENLRQPSKHRALSAPRITW